MFFIARCWQQNAAGCQQQNAADIDKERRQLKRAMFKACADALVKAHFLGKDDLDAYLAMEEAVADLWKEVEEAQTLPLRVHFVQATDQELVQVVQLTQGVEDQLRISYNEAPDQRLMKKIKELVESYRAEETRHPQAIIKESMKLGRMGGR